MVINDNRHDSTDTLVSVAAKVARGERLSDDDALALFESSDLLAIGALADQVNSRKNREHVFFNVNRHINPTNICALSCKFCAYSRKPGEEGAYAYGIDEMVTKAGEAVAQGATEVHMVGGLHPRWPFSHYKEMIAAVKTAYPDLHIKAFTAVELDWLARRARKTMLEVLEELRAVGLGSLPGGGAEIFHPEIRDAICDTKVPAEKWLDTHRQAHKLGMQSNCTMLYGHIESYIHRVDHMRRLRELQDETGGFNAFIPLSFQPFQNEMGIDRYTFGFDDLKTLAIARLYLDNFRHIKAYWVMLGQDVAQLALQFGANDLDGTVIEEKISRMAGGRGGMAMGRGLIETVVRKAQRIPQERDTLYRPVRRVNGAVAAGGEAEPESGARARDFAGGGDALRSLLNKLEYDDVLSEDELSLVAIHAYQHDLGRLAARRRDQIVGGGEASFAYTIVPPLATLRTARAVLAHVHEVSADSVAKYRLAPTTIAFDLAAYAQGEDAFANGVGPLLELIWAVRQGHGDGEIVLWGIKSLWLLAQQEGVAVAELAGRLREAGVAGVESSPLESETDLTHSEVGEIHRQLHRQELPTLAKVELVAPAHGSGEPLWETFVRRVRTLAALARPSGGVKGLAVTASPGSFVTAVEYMRAVAVARLAAPELVNILAPVAALPTMSPALGLGSSSQHQPAEKIAAVALHFGANDLGHVPAGQLSPVAVMQQIRSAGLAPAVRDTELAPVQLRAPAALPAQDGAPLRHVPELRA
jgi:aminodeoxyfutalosine synthase